MFLSDLRPLYELPGPWASVYLDASRHNERAREELRLRWRSAREALTDSGADPDRLRPIEEAINGDHTAGPHGLAIFEDLNQARVAHAETLPTPPAGTEASVSALPHVMPMLTQRGERVSWLRVVVDRTEGRIEQVVNGQLRRTETVDGQETYHLTKSKPGGWSAPRYQASAEENWERNASDVAAAVLDLAEEAKAEVLILAGDVRACQLLTEQLPRHWRDRTVHADGSLAAGADPERLDEATQRAVAEIAAARVADAIERFDLRRAHGTANSGLGATVEALQSGVAEAVLVNPSKLDHFDLWVGPEPAYLAVDDHELRRLGVSSPQREPAGDGIVRTAACTGAELFLVEEAAADLEDGVAVLMR